MSETKTATATPAPATAAGGSGTPGKELSVAQLARQIGAERQDAGEKKDEQAAAGDPAIKGDQQPDPAAAADLKNKPAATASGEGEAKAAELTTQLQTLKLSPEATAAVVKAFAEGGDIDAGALGLTDEQVAGLQKLADQHGEPAAVPEAGEELDLSTTKFTPEQKASINGMFKDRIGKVIARENAKTKAAEQQVQELRTQLDAKPKAVTAAIPLGDITTQEQLTKRAADAKEVKRWATTNLNRINRAPEAVEADLKKAGIELPEYTPEAMEAYFTNAETFADKTLNEDVPARAQYLKDEVAGSANAAKLFPDLEKADTQFGKDAKMVLDNWPEIKRLPHWKVIQGVVAVGLETMRQRDAAAAKAAGNGAKKINILPRTKVPKVNVRPGGAPRSASAGEAAENQAETNFKSSGSTADLAKMFGSRRK